MPTFRNYVRAFGRSWLVAMSGPLAVPLTIAAVYVEGNWQKAGWAALAIICAVYASFSIWQTERIARNAAEAQLSALKKEPPPPRSGPPGVFDMTQGGNVKVKGGGFLNLPHVATTGEKANFEAEDVAFIGAPDFTNTKPNDPCPCGSGKKFKKCHGQGAE